MNSGHALNMEAGGGGAETKQGRMNEKRTK